MNTRLDEDRQTNTTGYRVLGYLRIWRDLSISVGAAIVFLAAEPQEVGKRHKLNCFSGCTFIEQSCYPNAWKMGHVTPLFKKGDESNKANYRPVTVLPVLNDRDL